MVASTTATTAGDDHEEKLRVNDLPAPVREAVLKLANGRHVSEIETEKRHGKIVYKLKIGESEVLIHETGKVLSMKAERREHEDEEKEEKH